MKSILITGGTGFVGSNLIDKLLEDDQNKITTIVEPRFKEEFCNIIKKYKNIPYIENRLQMVEGDITQEGLGLSAKTGERLRKELNTVYHLAAVYLLEVGEEIANKVNIEGTKNMTDFTGSLDNLTDYNYISTCYVSGDRKGKILEDELDEGQKFNNFYESSKFSAEVYVRGKQAAIPTRIFRPSIIVGNSKTGETISFNGLYFAFDGMKRNFMGWPALVAIPGKGESKVNFTPIDYTIAAMTHISKDPNTIGKTYQLADPNPLTANEIIEECGKYFETKKPILGHLPNWMVDLSFNTLKFDKILKIQKELTAYMDAKTEYDVSNTLKALEHSGISCPNLKDYIPIIAKYWEENKD